MGMCLVVLMRPGLALGVVLSVYVRKEMKQIAAGEIELTVFAVAKADRSLEDFVQDRLQAGRACNSAKNSADRVLLRTQAFELRQ